MCLGGQKVGVQHRHFIDHDNFELIPMEGFEDVINCSTCAKTWRPRPEYTVESASMWQM